MGNAIETAKEYIIDNNYNDALKLARKRHGKDEVEDYLEILDLLVDVDYLPAIEEKGLYYQYFDESHDAFNGVHHDYYEYGSYAACC